MNEAPILPLQDDDLCFGCGTQNPIGLKMAFAWNDDTYSSRWTPQREHQGWAQRVHGGLLAVVLDEVLSRAILERHGLHWVTAELTTRLRRPAQVGIPLVIEARIETVRRALIVSRGEVREEATGLVVASGIAKLMRATELAKKEQ